MATAILLLDLITITLSLLHRHVAALSVAQASCNRLIYNLTVVCLQYNRVLFEHGKVQT